MVKQHINPGGSVTEEDPQGDAAWRAMLHYKKMSNGWDIRDHFGTVLMSFLTMVKLMFYNDAMEVIIRPIEDHGYLYNGLFWNLKAVFFVVMIIFGLVLVFNVG